MGSRFFVSAVIVLSALFAHAEGRRVLVVMKSGRAYQTAQQVMNSRESGGVLDTQASLVARHWFAVNAELQDSLKHVKSLVVKVGDKADIERLRRMPEVAFVEEEVFHPAPQPVGAVGPLKINLPRAVAARPAQSVPMGDFHPGEKTPWGIGAVKAMDGWFKAAGGEGVRVLVLDTGIDKNHPSIAENFEAGEDFVGDEAEPYPYFDRHSHGTHVAGTIAGVMDNAGFTGVAPKARLLAGRVCSASGCSNIAIAQGVNWGVEQKVDIISMSLGGAWATPAERDAIRAAEAAGVTIIAASGNDGTSRVSYPAALPEVIAVGAVNSQLERAAFSQYGPELAVVAPGVNISSCVPLGSGRVADVRMTMNGEEGASLNSNTFKGAADVPVPVENVLVYAGLGRAEDYAGLDVRGKFVLAARGEIKFVEKAQFAVDAGAAGLIIFNNAPGLVQGTLVENGSPSLPIPVFGIEQAAGEAVRDALLRNQVVSARLAVLATDYSALDGTSMATPHVSGVAALIKAVRRDLTPAQVKDILQRTATPLAPNAGNEFGAGLVNAGAAVDAALEMRSAPLKMAVGSR
ncbi:MAG: S8 family serine peptidase [Bdellovibrionaceae bacterium]|nr:S8 family serine peptidase [Pseudobdellovibrionaceae bacterium]MBX3033863.1 S8 family serine peptidase [Pseudobdellovibrionaceae bacterium]